MFKTKNDKKNDYYKKNVLKHFYNLKFYLIVTIIGIKEWFAPQISEHCP